MEAPELSTTAQGAGIKGARTLRRKSPRDDTTSDKTLPVAEVLNSAASADSASSHRSSSRAASQASGPDPLAASTVESWSHAELGAFVAGLGLKELLPNLGVLQADGRMIPVLMEEKMMQFAVDHKVKRKSLVMAMRVAFSGGVKMALDWPVSRVRSWIVSDGKRTEREARRAVKHLVHGAFLASMPADQLMRVFKIPTEEEAEQLAGAIASNTSYVTWLVPLVFLQFKQMEGFVKAGNSGAWEMMRWWCWWREQCGPRQRIFWFGEESVGAAPDSWAERASPETKELSSCSIPTASRVTKIVDLQWLFGARVTQPEATDDGNTKAVILLDLRPHRAIFAVGTPRADANRIMIQPRTFF